MADPPAPEPYPRITHPANSRRRKYGLLMACVGLACVGIVASGVASRRPPAEVSMPASGSAMARSQNFGSSRMSRVPQPRQRHVGRRHVGVRSADAQAAKEEGRRRLKELGYDPKLLELASGSKWDPTFQRWVKDDRTAYADIIITPKAGSPYIIWPAIFQVLKQKKLESVPTEQAEALADKNKAIIVDVRMQDEYDKSHVAGSINVPMFRDSTGTGVWDNLKRVVNAFIMTRSTERDPEFPQKVMEAVGGKNKPLILYCGMGGSLETKTRSSKAAYKEGFEDVEKSFGKESRSLKACFELINAGFSNVKHLAGGFSTWRFEKRPVE